jgi:hypothetical protein
LNPVTPETPLDHDSCTECVADVTPVPDRDMLDGELVALLLTVILPVADPLAVLRITSRMQYRRGSPLRNSRAGCFPTASDVSLDSQYLAGDGQGAHQ